MENFIVSARKYRPDSFNSVVGQESITSTLKNAIRTKHLAQAYLFCGPRGVGKTTCARIFAKTINCLNLTPDMEACNACESCDSFNKSRAYNIHELDAASNNSVEDIRSLIEQVRIPPQVGQYSIYIIDEVHMLSTQAFNAFLKTLEEPPKHAIFILATTEKHKIIPTILSRCQIFDFHRIQIPDVVQYLQEIAEKENIEAEPDGLNIIAQKADGAMRDALSIFDQIVAFTDNKITYRGVIDNLNVLDYEYYFKLTDAFLANDVKTVLLTFNEILENGFDGHNFINGLSSHFRDLLMCKHPETVQLLEVGDNIKQKYLEQSAKCPEDFILDALKVCSEGDRGYRLSKNKRLHVEFSLIHICRLREQKKKADSDKQLEPPAQKQKSTTKTPEPSKNKSATLKGEPKKPVTDSLSSYHATPSIKDAMIKKTTPHGTDTVDADAKEKKKTPLTEDELIEQWQQFATSLKHTKPRMYNSLRAIQPVLEKDYSILVELKNGTQEAEFNHDVKQRLINYLRNKFQNDDVDINVRISKEKEESQGKLYTDDDKFKYMSEKNPALQKLKQQFNLDFD
jgi:DNA polymerase-3 subunit gamma/tau